FRIESKKLGCTSQIEHSPRLAAIMRNIRSRHIARNQNRICIVWTDRGVEHGAAASRPDHHKISWASPAAPECKSENDTEESLPQHLIPCLSFANLRLST